MPNLAPVPPTAPVTEPKSGNSTPIWLGWFNGIYRLLGLAPTIYNGIVAPANIPNKMGDTYIDTIAKKVYVSVGTTSSADWKILN